MGDNGTVKNAGSETVLPDAVNMHKALRGMDLLDTPVLNKSTAFTYEERTALGLHGLLPPQVESIQEQVARAYEAYQRKTDDLERHIYLRALQEDRKSTRLNSSH